MADEKTITLTETELQAKIDDAVSKATNDLVSKHNGEMASLRTKHSAELERTKKEAGLSAEELAKKRAEEIAQANEQELADLRVFKKQTLLKDKLAKADLPPFLINDSRLLSAEEGDIDKVIKTIKGEYDASKPNGTTHSTVVPLGSGSKPTPSDKEIANEKMGDAIRELLK